MSFFLNHNDNCKGGILKLKKELEEIKRGGAEEIVEKFERNGRYGFRMSNAGGDNWSYYKKITVKENSGKSLTDFQVLVELNY